MAQLGRSLAPGLAVLRRYERAWLRHDVAAGLVLTALLIPTGMGYAEAAGLAAGSGLVASIAALVAYALVGPSRVLVIGPDSSLAPLIAAAVLPLAAGRPERAAALAGLMAVLVGALLMLGGVLRLGLVTDLLSKPIRTGYLAGIAAVVTVDQSSKLLGFSVERDGLWATLRATVDDVADGRINTRAAAFGVGCLVVVLVGRRLGRSAAAVSMAVLVSLLVAWLTGADDGLPTVGRLPAGLPLASLSELHGADVVKLLAPAAGTALIAFADVGVLSRTFAIRRREHVDQNQEMAAVGAANVLVGLAGGFPVSASSSRTPVAEAAGARTQLAGLVGAGAIVVFFVAGRSLPRYLPSATLAAVVIGAVSALVEPAQLRRLARMSRTEFALALATFMGVTTVGVMTGLVVAVALSLIAFVQRMWRPYTAELGRVDELKGYHDLERHPDGRRVPGLVIVRFDAPLFFANGAHFGQVVRHYVEASSEPVRWVVVAAEAITGVDTTAVDELVGLDDHLAHHGIRLVFAELKGPIKDRLARFEVAARFGDDRFFPTIGTAVAAYVAATGTPWVDWEEGGKAASS